MSGGFVRVGVAEAGAGLGMIARRYRLGKISFRSCRLQGQSQNSFFPHNHRPEHEARVTASTRRAMCQGPPTTTQCSHKWTAAFGTGGPPVFMFPFPCPTMDTDFIRTSATALGVLFATWASMLAIALVLLRSHLRPDPFSAMLATAIAALLRSIFLLADPYHYNASLPALLNGIIFGAVYPIRNLVTCLVFFGLHSLVARMEKLREGQAWRIPGWARPLIFLICVVQVLVQLFSDVVRAAGFNWYLLRMCRIFFVAWGLAIAICFTAWAVRLWIAVTARLQVDGPSRSRTQPGHKPVTTEMRRLFFAFYLYAFIGVLTCATSIFYLSEPAITAHELVACYTVDFIAEFLQCVAVGTMYLPPAFSKRGWCTVAPRVAIEPMAHSKPRFSSRESQFGLHVPSRLRLFRGSSARPGAVRASKTEGPAR